MNNIQTLKKLTKELKALQKEEKSSRSQADKAREKRVALASSKGLALVKSVILKEELLKHYTWTALWDGSNFYGNTCRVGNPSPVTLGVQTDSCKKLDPIADIMQKLPGVRDTKEYQRWSGLEKQTIELEEGVTLDLDGNNNQATYVLTFTDIDISDFLPFFKKSPARATCMANAQTVAEFVDKHNLKVMPPRGFKSHLKELQSAVDVGEQVAGLVKMVGYKNKAPKKAQAKKGKKK